MRSLLAELCFSLGWAVAPRLQPFQGSLRELFLFTVRGTDVTNTPQPDGAGNGSAELWSLIRPTGGEGWKRQLFLTQNKPKTQGMGKLGAAAHTFSPSALGAETADPESSRPVRDM